MPRRIKKPDLEKRARILADARRTKATRETGYRERAMALLPHICGRCGREFSGRNLRELTVHHKDHDHGNNPPDGSNWELLCLYCHDDEHQKSGGSGYHGNATQERGGEAALGHNPFGGLKDLLPSEGDE